MRMWLFASQSIKTDDMSDATYCSVPPATMSAASVLDMYYLDMRCALLEVASAFDRIDRMTGAETVHNDLRVQQLRTACRLLADDSGADRTEAILTMLSVDDPEPI